MKKLLCYCRERCVRVFRVARDLGVSMGEWLACCMAVPVVPATARPFVPTSRCYFLRLGVPLEATALEIQEAYKSLTAKPLHPAARRLIDEAYAVLGDDVRRELYVLTRRALVKQGLSADRA